MESCLKNTSSCLRTLCSFASGSWNVEERHFAEENKLPLLGDVKKLTATDGGPQQMVASESLAKPFERPYVQSLCHIIQDSLQAHPAADHLSEIVRVFFPASRKNIWEEIADQIGRLALSQVLHKELEGLRLELAGMQVTLELLSSAQPREQGTLLSALFSDLNMLFQKLFNSSASVHVLCLAVPAATLHLILLRHRFLFGDTIYGESNREQWWRDIETQWMRYDAAFFTLYQSWHEWRDSQIESTIGASYDTLPFFGTVFAFGTVKDKLTGEERGWKKHYTNAFSVDEAYFREVVQEYSRLLSRSLCAELGGVLEPVFYLGALAAKDESLLAAVFGTITLGPYHGPKAGKHMATTLKDSRGKIQAVRIRLELQDNRPPILAGMQVIYEGFDGIEAGSITGLHYLTLTVPPSQYIVGVRVAYYDDHIVGLQLIYSESDSSAVGYFDPGQVSVVAMPASYEMRGIEYLYGPERGVESLSFVFERSRPRIS